MFRFLRNRSSNTGEDLASHQVEFSTARYEPMDRLLNEEDLLFLRAQPGFKPAMGKEFSRERRRIFRLYLRELAADFYRLHAEARLIAASLPADHAPLVGVLIRQQIRFWYEMTAIELRLSLGWASSGTIRARALVEAISAMHIEISRLAIPEAA